MSVWERWEKLIQENITPILRECDVSDHTKDKDFDDFTFLVKQIYNCTSSIVTFIDTENNVVLFKSSCVSDPPSFFCVQSVLHPGTGMYEVTDSFSDPDYMHAETTKCLNLKYYAAAPIIINGRRVGSLCVIDENARPSMSEDQKAVLFSLCSQITNRLQLRCDMKAATKQHQKLNRTRHQLSLVAGTTSHDIRQPLSNIMMTTELLIEESSDLNKAQLSNIYDNACKIKEVVDTMLTFVVKESIIQRVSSP
ncbi:cell cycle protein GpsB [Acrasis kona]|uniref:Cell cycle protein GpsB n=1 Tax=Acrasis kona TaxID=1008807 RepID=A0AAW2Z5N3_9EUKA